MNNRTEIKRIISVSVLSSIILLAPISSQALTIDKVPNPRKNNGGWVTDMANILSDRTEVELNRFITDLEATNGTEIAVVTVPETAPAGSPKAFTTKLFNYWGIGKAEEDNGILFLISVGDRRVEIETGYGIEGILPDAKVGNIIDSTITPQFKQSNFDRGTLDGTKALISALDSSVTYSASNSKPWSFLLTGVGVITFLTGGTILWKRSRKVFVNPDKTRISLKRSNSCSIYCAKCKQPMERVENIELSKPQLIAQQIGSVSYRGYKCSSCSQDKIKGNEYLIIAYESQSSRYRNCPHCQELTVTRTKETVKKATRYSSGKRLITDKCHCCNYLKEKEENIPRLPPPSSGSYIGGGYSGGGGCSGSSGGGFGGGSSGGGGAGGGW